MLTISIQAQLDSLGEERKEEFKRHLGSLIS